MGEKEEGKGGNSSFLNPLKEEKRKQVIKRDSRRGGGKEGGKMV